jgi:hypothetical protein
VYCGFGGPSVPNYTNSLVPTVGLEPTTTRSIPSLRVLSISHMLMLIARRFPRKFHIFVSSHVSEAKSPLHGAGGDKRL